MAPISARQDLLRPWSSPPIRRSHTIVSRLHIPPLLLSLEVSEDKVATMQSSTRTRNLIRGCNFSHNLGDTTRHIGGLLLRITIYCRSWANSSFAPSPETMDMTDYGPGKTMHALIWRLTGRKTPKWWLSSRARSHWVGHCSFQSLLEMKEGLRHFGSRSKAGNDVSFTYLSKVEFCGNSCSIQKDSWP